MTWPGRSWLQFFAKPASLPGMAGQGPGLIDCERGEPRLIRTAARDRRGSGRDGFFGEGCRSSPRTITRRGRPKRAARPPCRERHPPPVVPVPFLVPVHTPGEGGALARRDRPRTVQKLLDNVASNSEFWMPHVSEISLTGSVRTFRTILRDRFPEAYLSPARVFTRIGGPNGSLVARGQGDAARPIAPGLRAQV